jgi:hypothetical protein
MAMFRLFTEDRRGKVMGRAFSSFGRIGLTVAVTALAASVASADVITSWTYPTGDHTVKVTPTTGTGVQTLVGGGTYVGVDSVSYYPVRSEGVIGDGLQWQVSTIGYEDIVLSLDIRRADGISVGRQWTWQYNLGSGWIDAAVFTFGNQIFNTMTLDLTSVAGAADNAAFAFRATTSQASTGAFNVHFDNVAVSGTAIPEPASITMVALGGLTLLLRRRRG